MAERRHCRRGSRADGSAKGSTVGEDASSKIPVRPCYIRTLAGIAQLVERQLPKLNVAGSNPVSRSEEPLTRFTLRLLVVLVAAVATMHAQPHGGILPSDSLDRQGVVDLSCCLKYVADDDALLVTDAAATKHRWKPITMGGDREGVIIPEEWSGTGWFKAEFKISERSRFKSLGLTILTLGACEIYLDGTLIHNVGKVAGSAEFDSVPNNRIFPLDPYLDRTDTAAVHSLMFRVRTDGYPSHIGSGASAVMFSATLGRVEELHRQRIEARTRFHRTMSIPFGMVIALGVLHLLLFIVDRRTKVNLLYALFAITFSGIFLCWHIQFTSTDPRLLTASFWVINALWTLIVVEALLLISMLLYGKISRRRWITAAVGGMLVFILPFVVGVQGTLVWGVFTTIATFDVGWHTVQAIRRREEGAWVVGIGLLLFSIYILSWFFGFFLGLINMNEDLWRVIFISGLVSMPLSMSIFLARRISATNRHLREQLDKVEDLTSQKLQQERRAVEEELRRQQLEVENQRKSHELEEARKLQFSMLPTSMPESDWFQLSVAMNTATEVGGDYVDYYFHGKDHLTFAIGDATGHGMKAGVMVATTKSHFQTHAALGTHADILNNTSDGIRRLHLPGLYMCLALLTIKGHEATWTAAGIPPLLHYQARTKSVTRRLVKGLPLGTPRSSEVQSLHFTVEPGDLLLMLTDGLPELFDPHHASLGIEPIEQMLVDKASEEASQILFDLTDMADEWRSGQPYNDDVTLMLIKITS